MTTSDACSNSGSYVTATADDSGHSSDSEQLPEKAESPSRPRSCPPRQQPTPMMTPLSPILLHQQHHGLEVEEEEEEEGEEGGGEDTVEGRKKEEEETGHHQRQLKPLEAMTEEQKATTGTCCTPLKKTR